jgi:hypothetical protein
MLTPGPPHHPHPAEAFEGVRATTAIATTNKIKTDRIFMGSLRLLGCSGSRIVAGLGGKGFQNDVRV